MARQKKAPAKAAKKRGRRTSGAAARPRAASDVANTEQPLPGSDARLLAVIDVGSGALRMAIGEAVLGKDLRRLDTLEVSLAIGLDTLSRGSIQAGTTEAAIRTLKDFIGVLESYGLSPADCRAVATTAVRDARNRDVFIDRVEQGCGLKIEVIEAIEEIRLIYQLVRLWPGGRLDKGSWMLLNLGFGGTQIVVQEEGRVLFEETLNYGLLKLADLRDQERSSMGPVRAFLSKIVNAVQRVQDLSRIRSLVVVNNEVRRLLGALARVRRGELGMEITRREMTRVHAKVMEMGQEELVANSGVDFITAERGRLALEELRIMADATDTRTIIVPDTTMMDSLLLDARLRAETGGQDDPLHDQVEAAARALGQKFHYDADHGAQVHKLSLELFDSLAPLLHLRPRSRLLLAVAATLHDIGYYVSPRMHERHSAYLIGASEIMGLNRSEVERVALIARSHRRPFLVLSGQALTRLPAEQRVEVLKLAALLRICEALDQDHSQRIQRLRVELSPESLHIYAVTLRGDRDGFSSIALAFKDKVDLFAEVFGVEPTLSEVLARQPGPRPRARRV